MMVSKSRLVVLTAIIFFGSILFINKSSADKSVDCSANTECRTAFVDAQNLAKEKKYEESLRILAPLFDKYPDDHLAYPLARLYHRLQRCAEAAVLYQRYLDSGIPTDRDEVLLVRKYLLEAQREAATRAATPPRQAAAAAGPARPETELRTPVVIAAPVGRTEAPPAGPAQRIAEPPQSPAPAVVPGETTATQNSGGADIARDSRGESSKQSVPLYKRWWLWTAVGVAVVGITVGTAVGVAAQQPSWPSAFEYKPFP